MNSRRSIYFKNHKYIIIASIIILLLIGLIINGFIKNVQENETAIADNNLYIAASNGANLIMSTFDNYMANLRTTALILEDYEDLTDKKVINMLNNIAVLNDYDLLAIDFLDGSSYCSDGRVLRITNKDYLSQIKTEGKFITNVTESMKDGTPIVNFFMPIYNKEAVHIASLRLSMKTSKLGNAINLKLFDSQGYYHLIDENGKYVAVGASDNALLMDENFFDAIALLEYMPGFSEDQIMETFKTGKSCYSKYAVGGEERYAFCESAGINNWVLMTIVPKKVISRIEQQNIYSAIQMAALIMILIIIIFVYIYIQQRKSNMRAILNDKCFRVLAEQSGKVILEWDFIKDTITPTTSFKSLFGREIITKSSAREAIEAGVIHKDDAEKFQSIFRFVLEGRVLENFKIRIRNEDGEYHWCDFSYVLIKDDKGKPFKAIGTLEDVDEKVKKEEELKNKSEKDQLTGVYNKVTTEKLIKDILVKSSENVDKHALFIIDIDDFKNINDQLGHQYGDEVLSKFSSILQSLVDEKDIVGRIGGDEFFVFLNNYKNVSMVNEKASAICTMIKNSCSDNKEKYEITASIGVSLYPKDGKSFEELYENSDLALYHTKKLGKNNYTVYDKTINVKGEFISNRTKID